MRNANKIILGVGGFFALLACLFLYYSARNFWTMSRMRETNATVVSSSLKIDWARDESEHTEMLVYLMNIELLADDGSGRVFHWEGDAGKATYPEEALDELANWKKGTHHPVAMLRGRSRELRMDHLEDNPELNAGVGWLFGVFFAGITAVSCFAAAGMEIRGQERLGFLRGMGAWTVFFGFGLVPLLGSLAFGVGSANKILSWQQVSAQKLGERSAFDTSASIENVVITPKAAKLLTDTPYDRVEFQWNGRTLHGGVGPWRGIYDQGMGSVDDKGQYRFVISPKDRWDILPKLDWKEDFAIPFGMMLFFGVAFCGAGLLIRKFETKPMRVKARRGS